MTIPTDNDQLALVSEKLINGYQEHHGEWGVPLSVAELAEAAHVEFTQFDDQCRVAASRLSEILIPACQEANSRLERILKASSKVLSLHAGERWNLIWSEAGHLNESTRIPDRMEDRLFLAKKLRTFYTKRTTWENAGLGLTAQGLGDATTALETAMKAVKNGELAKAKLVKECNRAAGRLRVRLRALLGEVKQVLGANDERWGALGLSTPAAVRASKDVRDRKAQVKAQQRAESNAVQQRKLAELAKAAYERARVRAEAAQVNADRLKETARKLSAKADAMFLKVNELDAKVAEGAAALNALDLSVSTRNAAAPASAPTAGAEPSPVQANAGSSLPS